jgi:hypothetical protein
MTVMVSISGDAEARLRERAAANGQDVEDYASQLLERAVSQPTLDELLEPVRADFAASGMTEDQIKEFGRNLLEVVRSDRKANAR